MRHQSGWLKLWRGAWEKDLGGNLYLWGLWHALLHLATWRETKVLWKGQQRVLAPGSVVFGVKEFAEKWNCSRSVIKKWLHHLHDTGRIVLESSPSGCIATICNWGEFQNGEDEAGPSRDQSVSTPSPCRVRDEPLKEEGKNKEVNSSVQIRFDFESAYKRYPRKQGKGKGLARLKRDISSEADYQALLAAIDRYKGSSDVQKGFVKLFSTFVSEWRDWVDPQTGQTDLPSTINLIPLSLEELS